MLFPSVSAFLLPLFVLPLVSSVAVPRSILPTGQNVKKDILNIQNAVLALDAKVQAYDGSPLPFSIIEGTPVLLEVAKIHVLSTAGLTHALAALPYTIADSNDVIDTATATVNESIPAAVEHIKRKLDAFKEGALVPVVLASLTLLLADHDTFGAAALAKVNIGVGPAKIKEGVAGIAHTHGVIKDAISYYAEHAI